MCFSTVTWTCFSAVTVDVNEAVEVVHQQLLRVGSGRDVERAANGFLVLEFPAPLVALAPGQNGKQNQRHECQRFHWDTSILCMAQAACCRTWLSACASWASLRSAGAASCRSTAPADRSKRFEPGANPASGRHPPARGGSADWRRTSPSASTADKPHIHVGVVVHGVEQRLLHLCVGPRHLVAVSDPAQPRAGRLLLQERQSHQLPQAFHLSLQLRDIGAGGRGARPR